MAHPGWTRQENSDEYYALHVAWKHEEDRNYAPFTADVRFDGCVHLRRFHNGASLLDLSDDDVDYLHICDLDEMIAMLTELKDFAQKEFGEDWSS